MVFLEGEADAAPEFADWAVLLGRLGFEDDREDELGALDGVDAEDLGIGDEEVLEVVAGADVHGDLFEHVHNLVGVGGEVDADVHGGDRIVDAEVGNGCDLRVGDDVDGSIASVAEDGLAESHGLDDTGDAGDLDGVTYIELVFEEDHDAVEHVADDVLGGEAYGYSGDAGRREERSEVDSDGSEKLHGDNGGNDRHAGGADDAGHGSDLGDAHMSDGVLFGDADHAGGYERENAVESETDEGCNEEVGKFNSNEFLGIADPLVQDLSEKAAFGGDLRPGCEKKGRHTNSYIQYLYCAELIRDAAQSLGPLQELLRLNRRGPKQVGNQYNAT